MVTETLIVSRPDRIGDVVISTSCLAPLRQKFPEARIFFVATEALRPLLEKHSLLDGFISLSPNLKEEFARAAASAIVHLHADASCYRAAADAGIPVRVGYALGSDRDALTQVLADRRTEGLQHEGAYNFDLLGPLGVELPAKLTPSIHLPEQSRESLRPKLPWPLEQTNYVLLAASAHSPHRRWPNESFVRLAERLHGECNLTPVFVGAAGDDVPTPKFLSLVGRTDLAELAWLLRYARLLITTDTGPSHIAAAVASPQVVIFGRTEPRYGPTRWRPLSDSAAIVTKPLRKRFLEGNAAFWRRSFAAISVDDVMTAAKTILADA